VEDLALTMGILRLFAGSPLTKTRRGGGEIAELVGIERIQGIEPRQSGRVGQSFPLRYDNGV